MLKEDKLKDFFFENYSYFIVQCLIQVLPNKWDYF